MPLMPREQNELAGLLSRAHDQGATDDDLRTVISIYKAQRGIDAQSPARAAIGSVGRTLSDVVGGTKDAFIDTAKGLGRTALQSLYTPGPVMAARALDSYNATSGAASKRDIAAAGQESIDAGRNPSVLGALGDAGASGLHTIKAFMDFIPGQSAAFDAGDKLVGGDARAAGPLIRDLVLNTAGAGSEGSTVLRHLTGDAPSIADAAGGAVGPALERSAAATISKQLPKTELAAKMATPETLLSAARGGPALTRQALQSRVAQARVTAMERAMSGEQAAADAVMANPKPIDLTAVKQQLTDAQQAALDAGGRRRQYIDTLDSELSSTPRTTAEALAARKDLNAAARDGGLMTSGSGKAKAMREVAGGYAGALRTAEPEYGAAASALSDQLQGFKGAADLRRNATDFATADPLASPVGQRIRVAGIGIPGVSVGGSNILQRAIASPLWASVRASTKAHIAGLLQAGNIGDASIIADSAIRALQPSQSQETTAP